jgi:trehalose synthase
MVVHRDGKDGPPMSIAPEAVEKSTLGLHPLEQYEPLIGSAKAEAIFKKADRVRGAHVVHVNSTFYGGGVTEILTPLTLMMNAIGVETGWRQIQGTPDFFHVTKKLHNALQGDGITLSDTEKAIYEVVVLENAARIHLSRCDAVIVHDPQPLPLVGHFADLIIPWLWQCHIDLSQPDPATWNYLRAFVDQYDAAIFSLPEYGQNLDIVQRFITPAIDPFSAKNAELLDAEIDACLEQYRIPSDRPLVTQISRFDRWKDPMGVVEAFHKARRQVDCTLVLVGNGATDDPEGEVVLETIRNSIDESVVVVTADNPVLVNALQRRAAVVLQKSTREGFGLTVTEAMWKGAAVIGGDVGGIRRQIRDGENGFLVRTVDQAAHRIVQLLRDPGLRERIGARARETVRENFLMSRLLEDWLDVLAGYRRP